MAEERPPLGLVTPIWGQPGRWHPRLWVPWPLSSLTTPLPLFTALRWLRQSKERMGTGWDGEEHHAQRRDLKRRETGKRMERGEEEENVARGAGEAEKQKERQRKWRGRQRNGGVCSETQAHATQSPGWPEGLISRQSLEVAPAARQWPEAEGHVDGRVWGPRVSRATQLGATSTSWPGLGDRCAPSLSSIASATPAVLPLPWRAEFQHTKRKWA